MGIIEADIPECDLCGEILLPLAEGGYICSKCGQKYEEDDIVEVPEEDMVNHPNHYMSETGLEVIEVIEAFTFALKGIEAVDTAHVIKYICRWKKKNGIEDLKKAQWYLNNLIKHVGNLEKEKDES